MPPCGFETDDEKIASLTRGYNAMFCINKITSNSVVDYAAEELRKYLRMMMPDMGMISNRVLMIIHFMMSCPN